MNLDTLINTTQDLLEDPGGFASFSDEKCVSAVEFACRYIANNIGRTSARFAMDMVNGQADYDFPEVVQVRRVSSIRIIPVEGSPSNLALNQIDISELPLTSVGTKDPDRFALNLAGGANEDRYSISLYPTPTRNTTDSIVVDYEVDYIFDIDNQASQNIPFPPQFHLAVKNLTAHYLLMQKDNETDRRHSLSLKSLADNDLFQNRSIDSIGRAPSRRAFP